MKSIILYSTSEKTKAHTAVPVTGTNGSGEIYVRAMAVNGNVSQALDQAGKLIRPGETVLNTIPIPERSVA